MSKSFFQRALGSFLSESSTTASEANPVDPGVKAINALGIDLLHKAFSPDANALISPYSIQTALAMTYAGADGQTRDEMAKVLHYPKDEAALHRSLAEMRKQLEGIAAVSAYAAAKMKQYREPSEPLALVVANRLFGQSGYDFRSAFLSLLKDTYEAPFEAMDFVRDASGATKRINDWVEEQTRHCIHDLVPPGVLDELTRLVLVNAIYLKAAWRMPFRESTTKPSPFHLANGNRIDVPTMTQQADFRFSDARDCRIVAIPYAPKGLHFLILLPKRPDGLPELEARLKPEMLVSCRNVSQQEIILSLPKFKLEEALPLRTILKGLGMRTAFDEPRGSANFDRMAPRRPEDYLLISEVFHKTFLNLDEKGTEAAAATAVCMVKGLAVEKKPFEVKVDRPFLFAIQETQTGACLFLGRVTDPR